MTRAISAELRKFLTTRMWWGMAIAIALASGGLALLFGLVLTSSSVQDQPGAATTDLQLARTVFTGGIGLVYLLTLAIGVLTIGAEYRHKTITSTFLATPHRVRVMLAKIVSLLVIGAGYGVLSILVSVGVGTAVLSAKGHDAFADPAIWRSLALALLVLGLWALIGLGAGILIPNQVAALLVAVGVAWIVEPILGAVLGLVSWGRDIVPYLPSQATSAMLGDTGNAFGGGPSDATTLSWWAGALVLMAYAAVMAGVGSALTTRRDIS
ncbi:ABC transporter permease [Lapillicoccus jejuensis]|uniref:ABC-2 family transporter n=1 Tax=Lapillicoccus jejuensis TaxID=402171 RepID=A0A542E2M9_9MICO|nr:ABC transporter permease [Lapillicoccus jejuensis]TQJ09597.1 hypothetical protein FB458_2709 [Lapillicoccus jejuensis]